MEKHHLYPLLAYKLRVVHKLYNTISHKRESGEIQVGVQAFAFIGEKLWSSKEQGWEEKCGRNFGIDMEVTSETCKPPNRGGVASTIFCKVTFHRFYSRFYTMLL